MNEDSQGTLKAIEALLVADKVSARHALEAAYYAGRLDGQIEISEAAERKIEEALKEGRQELKDAYEKTKRWQKIADQRAVEVADLTHKLSKALA